MLRRILQPASPTRPRPAGAARVRPRRRALHLLLGGWVLLVPPTSVPAQAPPPGPDPAVAVDSRGLRHKVLCGYQGWFRCPGDPAGEGYRHWSRRADELTPRSVTFEMWPDLGEFTPDEKYLVPGFTHPDAQPAFLFSSAHPRTVLRHFQWMQQYGLDGAFLQRFLVELHRPSLDLVLEHVRAAAAATGRVYAVCYDLTGAPPDQLVERLTSDWRRLVDRQQVTRDDRYLHHRGRPVVFVWGFFSDRFAASIAHRLIDAFEQDDRYRATLIGGCQWQWRSEPQPDWARAFRRLPVISPWNVGNVSRDGPRKYATTSHWPDDRAGAHAAGAEFLPVVYPGFSWTNLQGRPAAADTVPRLGGEFYWRQFLAAAQSGADAVYVAMFDEVDEGTAIFKVSNSPPQQAEFASYEGLPADWYLRLTGEGARLLRGQRPADHVLPIQP
jgi:hypothetical protein